MTPLHPSLVHFAVALFPLSVIFDILGILTGNQKYLTAARLNLAVSALFVLAAVGSGLLEKSRLQVPISAASTFEIHETLAFIIAGSVIGLFFWRFSMKNADWTKFKYLYLALAFTTMLILLTGSYYGGKLVYKFGVGVRSTSGENRNLRQQQKVVKSRASEELSEEVSDLPL
ncbi:MAG: DUF2231 domain-containing protein [Calditrichaeota bacterium]|nr:DUF2231 domain-containing protein [Calditrichota bacterium]RQV99228.1 MAG: DUF2231 domain-containing protein [Calditrichota bacterium]